MLRDTIVATLTALALVAAHALRFRFITPTDTAPDARVREALNHRIVGEHTVRAAPRDAFVQLNAAGAGLMIEWTDEWPYLEREAREPINLTLHDATVEQWLQAITFQLGGPFPCYWTDIEGKVHVAAPHRLRPPVATRVYDVRDLLEIETRFVQEFPRQNFAPPEEPATRNPLVFGEWGLVRVLGDIAGGYTWIVKGGGGLSESEVAIGDIEFRDGRLIVSHTLEVHRRISALLVVLRAGPASHHISEGTR